MSRYVYMYGRRGTGRCKYGGGEKERSGGEWVGGGEKIGRRKMMIHST